MKPSDHTDLDLIYFLPDTQIIPKRSLQRQYNIDIWKDTKMKVIKGEVCSLPPLSRKYSFKVFEKELSTENEQSATVKVYNTDTFDLAKQLIDRGLNPLVLNMANHKVPGGGVTRGAQAQEECLYRRSNYFATLSTSLYPLYDNQAIYSPDITVFKNSDYIDCEPWKCSCIAVAGVRKPRPNPLIGINHSFTDDETSLTFNKIQLMFHVAALNGHDSLVLGAIGCGAFNNPADEVCNLFKEVISNYGILFKEIVFAVMSGKDNPNYLIFKAQLESDKSPDENEVMA